MKKSDLTDVILQTIPKENRDNYPRGLVSRIVGMALNTIYFKIFAKNPEFINDYLKPFSLTTVKHDEQISIISIPIETLQFAEIGDAVRITCQSDLSILFVPIRINEIGMIQQIQVIDAVIPFELKNDKIYLYGLSREIPLIVEVLPAFNELDDNESIKIPSGADVELIQNVRELLGIAK